MEWNGISCLDSCPLCLAVEQLGSPDGSLSNWVKIYTVVTKFSMSLYIGNLSNKLHLPFILKFSRKVDFLPHVGFLQLEDIILVSIYQYVSDISSSDCLHGVLHKLE